MPAPTTADHVAAYRTAAAAIRGINARQGSNGATIRALARHAGIQATAVTALLSDTRNKPLVGLLIEEEQLSVRLWEARRSGQQRPELIRRLVEARAETRVHVTASQRREPVAC